MTACILHSVRCDDEHGMLRNILNSCVLMDVANVMNCSTDSVKKRCAASYAVLRIGHRLDILDINPVMDDFACIVEENSGNQCFSFCLFLLFNHCIKAADGICLKPTHRAAAVKDEYDLCQVLLHVQFLQNKI